MRHPLQVYGLEFRDLTLPITVDIGNNSLRILGSFSIPSMVEKRQQTLPLATPQPASRLIMVTTVTDADALADRQNLAKVTLISHNNATTVIPIRIGEETVAWDKTCPPTSQCETVYQWHKKIAMVGQRRYPDAWRDFQAGLHAVNVQLRRQMQVEELNIRYVADQGRLHVWGIALTD